MLALFNDAALLDDHDLVRVLDCAQAMGDHKRGAIFQQAFERLLHQVLAFIVERTGRLVEDEQAWIAQECPCNGNALTLPARKLLPVPLLRSLPGPPSVARRQYFRE